MAVAKVKANSSLLDILESAKLVTAEQAKHVRDVQQHDGRKISEILLAEALVEPERLMFFISLQTGIPYYNLKKQEVDPKAVVLLPEWVCRKYLAIPLRTSEAALIVAMADPGDIQAVDDIAAISKSHIEPVLALRTDIQEAIDRNYRVGSEIESELLRVPGLVGERGPEMTSAELTSAAVAEAPVVRAVDMLMRQAARDRASDIHIEPQEAHLRIRFRIDGILHEVMTLPMNVHAAIISRLKIIAGMNIAESRRPQDGQTIFRDGDREVDVRVATCPTVHGEMAVLRLLDKSFAFRTLPELGFLPEALASYETLLKLPFGMILVSGPTGSGKTTTLYASVNKIDNVGRNVITIEDPVEYRFANINQVQVNALAGMTFASGLRAAMRLDPNVILVGEIRDRETSQVAIQAALTGHLVLSTVHANDTAGVIFRLIDLGVEPFMAASAIAGIMAQRMVRRLCPNCSTLTPGSAEDRLAYEKEMKEERTHFLYGAGCNYCARTGYLGRTGIYEVMLVTEAIRRLILASASMDDIRNEALRGGMVSLWHDGMIKVKMGLTTPYEVLRNVFTIS